MQNGANVNAIDKDGKTVLHYVADAGITRAIGFLIQKGADVTLQDSKKLKTALEIAANDRVREAIVTHSAHQHKQGFLEDHKYLTKNIRGTYLDHLKSTNNYRPKSGSLRNESCVVPEFVQKSFINIMRKLQHEGVI